MKITEVTMSKVYDYQQQMDELCNEADYQDFLAEQEHKAQEEAFGMDKEEYARVVLSDEDYKLLENMESNKAEEFARKIIEVAYESWR